MTLRMMFAVPALALLTYPATADSFNRIGSFPAIVNTAEVEDSVRESSDSIILASQDGLIANHIDSPLGIPGSAGCNGSGRRQ